MKKKLKYIIIGIIVIAGAYFYSHIAKTHMIYDREVDTSDYKNTGVILEGNVEQQFKSKEETLDGVRVKCQVVGRPQQETIEYTLTDIEQQSILATGEAKVQDLKNSKFYEFKFDEITGCKDKEYLFTLNIKNGSAEEGIAFYYEGVIEEHTSLAVNGEQKEGTLILKTVTHRFDLETFAVILFFALYIVVFMKFLYRLFK